MSRNLVVVGKNSSIGRSFAEYAKDHFAEVISISSRDCNFLECDEVIEFFRHLGAAEYCVVFLAVINKSVDNSFQSALDNLRIVKNLVDGQKFANISSIVYFSSVDVYGVPALPITEQSPINPDTWYGLAKYACEWTLMSSGEVNCPVTILRIPGVYGCLPNDKSVIGTMVGSVLRENRVIINGSGNVLRDYVYVGDLCRLLEVLVPLRFQGVLNAVTGQSRSISDIARLIGKVLGRDIDIVFNPPDPSRHFDLVFDNRLLRRLVPEFHFSDISVGITEKFREATWPR